ncbi:MAG: hypothetical protein AUG51_09760 [Acidobacteria bacterium 13_1_20CM_3_53_8]|nr:MAG: hypothetical protein AUG51_09760 [Acidobacteria bacterium 13_1_20CM_3_53_8]
MFQNLIESESHAGELKRRSKFMLGVMALYSVLMFVGGVVSIYAYDAHLESQSLELTTMLAPVEVSQVEVIDRNQAASQVERSSNELQVDFRRDLIADINTPTLAPDQVSTQRSDTPPVRPNMPTIKGNTDSNAILRNSGMTNDQGIPGALRNNSTTKIVVDETPPPPRVVPSPPKIIRATRVLNGEARSLPKPAYPQMALLAHVGGVVSVQVLIDESGRVVSAKAVSGHPLLLHASELAAYQARFSPTTINDQPVKVSGVITYNFVLP